MSTDELVRGTGIARRDFLRNSMMLTLPLMAGTAFAGMRTGGALRAMQAVYVPPSRQRGDTIVNVLNYGAKADGIHDDTTAIQAAINSLPSTGGTVVVPAGTYLIDAVRSIRLRSLMHLQMDLNAKLVVKTNSSDRYIALECSVIHDVEISGGQIYGDRDTHMGTSGEGGHCVHVGGSSRVTIRDMYCAKGWGDGISVGPKPQNRKTFIYSKDVVVANVVCTGNRRNGLSITNVIGMKVFDSEFSDTNGTTPQCGIDVEPNKDIDGNGYNDQVWIENCVMRGNAAYGVNVWNRARNLTITKCTISDNKSCGIVTTGLVGGTFTENTVCNNMKTGIAVKVGTTNYKVSGNTFYNNYLKQGLKTRTPFYLTGVSSKVQKDLVVGTGTSSIQVGSNYYK
jgi:parallel beta-helix repeat protein